MPAITEAQFRHALDVVIDFGFGHADVGAAAIGQGIVVGETDFAQAEFDRALDIIFHRSRGVFAQRRVHVIVALDGHGARL